MNYNLEAIDRLPDGHPIKASLIASGGSTYAEFCESVENAILSAIHHLEKAKSIYVKLGEDAITLMIIFALGKDGLDADHDALRNGHCDIVVKKGMYEWYGEAKLDKGPAYILDGFRQLCDRYSPGGPTTNRGGMLVYTNLPRKLERLEGWLDRIEQEFEPKIDIKTVCKNTLTGWSSHVHQASGLDFVVRHFPISMYHNPTD